MQRAERIGLGVALAGHVALFAALSLGLFSTEEIPPRPDPVQVSLIGEVAPVATAPQLSSEAPAPAPADDIGDPLDAMADPLPQVEAPAPVTQTQPAPPRAEPRPVPKPDPKPAPKPKEKAAPKPEPKKAAPKKAEPKKAETPKAAAKPTPKPAAKPQPAKSSGGSRATADRSRSFAENMRGSIGTTGKAANPPAAAYSETTRRQIDVSIKGEIAPLLEAQRAERRGRGRTAHRAADHPQQGWQPGGNAEADQPDRENRQQRAAAKAAYRTRDKVGTAGSAVQAPGRIL